MTRSLLSMRFLTVLGAVALFACGPRLKPVEYEEPKLSGSGAPDDSEPGSGSSKASKSKSSDDESTGSGAGAGVASKGSSKSCEEKTACGTPCTECPAGNLDCMEVLIEKQCNLEHKCVAAPANCTAPEKSGDKKGSKAAKQE